MKNKHCWLRLRFHDWGEPFKKKVEDICWWKECKKCGWRVLVRVE